jgi:hypothetical protein
MGILRAAVRPGRRRRPVDRLRPGRTGRRTLTGGRRSRDRGTGRRLGIPRQRRPGRRRRLARLPGSRLEARTTGTRNRSGRPRPGRGRRVRHRHLVVGGRWQGELARTGNPTGLPERTRTRRRHRRRPIDPTGLRRRTIRPSRRLLIRPARRLAVGGARRLVVRCAGWLAVVSARRLAVRLPGRWAVWNAGLVVRRAGWWAVWSAGWLGVGRTRRRPERRLRCRLAQRRPVLGGRRRPVVRSRRRPLLGPRRPVLRSRRRRVLGPRRWAVGPCRWWLVGVGRRESGRRAVPRQANGRLPFSLRLPVSGPRCRRRWLSLRRGRCCQLVFGGREAGYALGGELAGWWRCRHRRRRTLGLPGRRRRRKRLGRLERLGRHSRVGYGLGHPARAYPGGTVAIRIASPLLRRPDRIFHRQTSLPVPPVPCPGKSLAHQRSIFTPVRTRPTRPAPSTRCACG